MATPSMTSSRTSSFEEALESFKTRSGLTPRELSEMEMTTLLDVQRSLAAMQKSQQRSKTMIHLRRLQPFLDAMEQYGKVVDVFVNTSNVVAFIWGPMKFLLLIASNVTEAFNVLLDGYQSIGEHLPLLARYRQLFEDNSDMRPALASIFEDVLDFHLVAVKLFRQKTWKQLFHATQRTLVKKVQEITQCMEKHRNILEAQTTLAQFQELQATRALIKARFADQERAERDRRRQYVQQWLVSTIDSLSRHEDFKKERFANTGQWLIDDPRFQNWFAPEQCGDPLLWLHGLPGAGKTVLASRVVEEIAATNDTVGVCFYCRQVDEQRNSFLSLAQSIISQILALNDSVLDYLYDEMSSSGQATLTSLQLAKKLLRISLESCRRVYIVIDGLDEYSRENRKEIANWFQELVQNLTSSDTGSVRCLFVSQDDGPARKDLSTLSQIKITPVENREDIEDFCSNWHQRIEAKFGPLINPLHCVAKIISARAQGMFLYARLMTWNLSEQTCRADFEAEMEPGRVPEGLDQVYDRIVQRLLGPGVPSARRKNIQRLLGWLACAKRPLKWYEIQGAVAFDVDEGLYSERLRFSEDCKDLCASLVDVLTDQTVTLVHSTTRQYLLRHSLMKISNAELDLAIVCLSYLAKEEFRHDFPEGDICEAYLQGFYAFSEYATCFWPLHTESAFRDCSDDDSGQVELMMECFEAFLATHYLATGRAEAISTKLRQNLQPAKESDCFIKFCTAIATAKSWLRPTSDCLYDKSVLQLPQTIKRLRVVFETATSPRHYSDNEGTSIAQLYGTNRFKCARVNCQFFQQGFTQFSERDDHHNKHERSFTCAYEGCPYETIGFTTIKELQKHTSIQHGVELDTEKLEFPDESATASPLSKGQGSRRFKCTQCLRFFARSYNLKIHQRSHANQRPFKCSLCGDSFSRRSDCKRHEKLHAGDKTFICMGNLEKTPGKTWGCGRRYARQDALLNHFRSAAGQPCVQPFIDEGGTIIGASQLQSEHFRSPPHPDRQASSNAGSNSISESRPSPQTPDHNLMFDKTYESDVESVGSGDRGPPEDSELNILLDYENSEDLTHQSVETIQGVIIARLREVTRSATSEIDPQKSLSSYGVSSLDAIEWCKWISEELKVHVTVWDMLASTPIILLAEKIANRLKFLSGVAEARSVVCEGAEVEFQALERDT